VFLCGQKQEEGGTHAAETASHHGYAAGHWSLWGAGTRGGRAVRAAGVQSQSCVFESLEICKSLNFQNPNFELCPPIELCDSTATGTSTSTVSTVSSGAVSATVTITGGSAVSLLTSTTSHEGQVSTCIQIMVDDLAGAFCEVSQSGPLTYQCDITSDSSVHGTCICQSNAPAPTPSACTGLEGGCKQFGGDVHETADGKLCEFPAE